MKPQMVMSEEKRTQIREELARAKDWYGICRSCGASLIGTMAEIRAHKCEVKHV